jgi:signal transduction histidine kinase
MRAPLSMILSTIETARRCRSIEELKETLKMSEINAKLLDCLIADILDHSLYKENKLNLVCKHFDLTDALEESLSLIKLQALHKNIEVKIENKLFNNRIYSDERRLKQVLINLLTNSLKFTREGSIQIRAEDPDDRAMNIMISVTDTGTGKKKREYRTVRPGLRHL